MKSVKLIVAVIGICLLMTTTSSAKDEEKKGEKIPVKLLYATESGIGIRFGGEVEMEFVDVEGAGGFSNQDLTLQKVKTRSPHMRIDKAILETEIFYSENLTYKIQFRFGDDGTRVDKHYARLEVPSIYTRFELGKNRPFVARERMTEGYPLLGTSYWKGREYHITSVTKYPLSDDVELTAGVSVAMKRPLGTDDAAEDKSFKMLVSDDYDTKDGQTFEYGGMLGLEALGVSLLGWYYTGSLIDDFDWKTQLSQNLQAYDDLGDETDRTHYWYGGRAGFDAKNLHLCAEVLGSQDGLLSRSGYYVEGAYFIPQVSGFMPINGIMPLVRYGILNVEDHPRQLGNPNTWDRTMTTIALLAQINDYLNLKFEYYILDEETLEDEDLGGENPEDHVDDNQMVVQINFKF